MSSWTFLFELKKAPCNIIESWDPPHSPDCISAPVRTYWPFVCVPAWQLTGHLPPLPRYVYLHSQPRITCHSAATVHPLPPIAWLRRLRGRGLYWNRIKWGKQDVTERRGSQRTGNTETCQREQEGEMEGLIEGGGLRWGGISKVKRSKGEKWMRGKNKREEEGSWKNRAGLTREESPDEEPEKKHTWGLPKIFPLQLWSPLLDPKCFVVIMIWFDKHWWLAVRAPADEAMKLF